MASPSVPIAIAGAVGLCVCSEHLAHIQWGRNCTCRRPSSTCVHPQPRTPFSAPLSSARAAW
eukprot:4554568-Alexandrium_andersonii.AAC.1